MTSATSHSLSPVAGPAVGSMCRLLTAAGGLRPINFEKLSEATDAQLLAAWRELRAKANDARKSEPGAESDGWSRFSREWSRLDRERCRRGLMAIEKGLT